MNFQIKYKLKHNKEIRYIGIPKENSQIYHQDHLGCKQEQSRGMLRNLAAPGKQRYIFTDNCHYASYDFLDLDDLPIIIQHDFDYAIFQVFGTNILQLKSAHIIFGVKLFPCSPFSWLNYQNGIKDEASLRWPPTAAIRMTFNYVRKCNQKKTNIGYVLIKHREADS